MLTKRCFQLIDKILVDQTRIKITPFKWNSKIRQIVVLSGLNLLPAILTMSYIWFYTGFLLYQLYRWEEVDPSRGRISPGAETPSQISVDKILHTFYTIIYIFASICAYTNFTRREEIKDFMNMSLAFHEKMSEVAGGSSGAGGGNPGKISVPMGLRFMFRRPRRHRHLLEKMLRPVKAGTHVQCLCLLLAFLNTPLKPWHLFSVLAPPGHGQMWWRTSETTRPVLLYGALVYLVNLALIRTAGISIMSLLIHWFGCSDCLRFLIRSGSNKTTKLGKWRYVISAIMQKASTTTTCHLSVPKSLRYYQSLQILNKNFNSCFASPVLMCIISILVLVPVFSYHLIIRYHRKLPILVFVVIFNLSTFMVMILVRTLPVGARIFTLSTAFRRFLQSQLRMEHSMNSRARVGMGMGGLIIGATRRMGRMREENQDAWSSSGSSYSRLEEMKRQIRATRSIKIQVGRLGFIYKSTCIRVYGIVVYWTFKSLLLFHK